MAGVSYAGATHNRLAVVDAPLFPGDFRGQTPFSNQTAGRPTPALIGAVFAGVRTAATETDGFADSDIAYAGTTDEQLGGGADWYEDLHVLPRTVIEFGNIITQVERVYEIYNAYRSTTIGLNGIDATSVQPGVTLPEMVATYSVPPQTSALHSTTTGNTTGIGLGTIVKLKVVAANEGLPRFDGFITFEDTGTGELVSIRVTGSRLVMIPMIYEAPVTESLEWLTDLMESIDGREQRLALRAHPRAIFSVRYLLDGNDRQRMLALLFDWSDATFGFPLWHERVTLTAAAGVGTTVYQISGGDQIDLRAGGLAVVISDNSTYDVINVSSFTATTLTALDPSVNSYPIGASIMPLRTAVLQQAVEGANYLNELEVFDVTFEVTDNDTGAVAGSTTPGWWSTYNSRVLFDDCNIAEGETIQTQYPRRIIRIDNETGVISQSSSWDRNKRGTRKGFFLKNRSEIYNFRKLLTALRGRQKAVYLPTFQKDLTVVANLAIGNATMDIEAMEYVRHVNSRLPMKVFRITFTDGTSLVREIQSAATISSTVERLTLDTTWPANRTVAEIRRVQFYELVRFDTDRFEITHERIGRARCNVPVVRVFDDNP
jgi:hypothetical protein